MRENQKNKVATKERAAMIAIKEKVAFKLFRIIEIKSNFLSGTREDCLEKILDFSSILSEFKFTVKNDSSLSAVVSFVLIFVNLIYIFFKQFKNKTKIFLIK